MANPLKVKKTGATFNGLQIMTDAEMDYSVDVVLKLFANTNSGLGTVNIDGATGTSIGTFVDTSRSGAVGDHPVTDSPITVTTYTFKQDVTTAATEVITRPIEHSSSGIRQQNDTQLNAAIISRALANCASSGIGSYALQPTSPAGTWSSIGTISNSVLGASITLTNITTLWRKTGGTAPTTVRPLKYQTSPSKSFKEMTDAEIQGLTNRLRNQIISTGICTYKLQASAPTPGTWTTRGAAFSDTRNTLADTSYSGSYTGNFTGSYTGTFAGTYVGTFAGTYSRAFSSAYTGFYSTFYSGFAGPPTYTGFYSSFFTGFFAGSYTGVIGSFAGTYTGAYSTAFAGSYSTFYSGFAGPPAYAGFYTGFFTGSYTGTYTTGGFAGSYARAFAGSYAGAYAGFYAGTTIQASTATISTVSLWVRTA